MLSPSVPPFRILHGAEAVAALDHRPSWAELWRCVSDPEPPPLVDVDELVAQQAIGAGRRLPQEDEPPQRGGGGAGGRAARPHQDRPASALDPQRQPSGASVRTAGR